MCMCMHVRIVFGTGVIGYTVRGSREYGPSFLVVKKKKKDSIPLSWACTPQLVRKLKLKPINDRSHMHGCQFCRMLILLYMHVLL